MLMFLFLISFLLGLIEGINQYLNGSPVRSVSNGLHEFRNQNYSNNDARHNKCERLYKKHKVEPGNSWGTMSLKQQDLWMKIKCDHFFCKPNKMEGRGKYKCEQIMLD